MLPYLCYLPLMQIILLLSQNVHTWRTDTTAAWNCWEYHLEWARWIHCSSTHTSFKLGCWLVNTRVVKGTYLYEIWNLVKLTTAIILEIWINNWMLTYGVITIWFMFLLLYLCFLSIFTLMFYYRTSLTFVTAINLYKTYNPLTYILDSIRHWPLTILERRYPFFCLSVFTRSK